MTEIASPKTSTKQPYLTEIDSSFPIFNVSNLEYSGLLR